jgi:hypothetical protein
MLLSVRPEPCPLGGAKALPARVVALRRERRRRLAAVSRYDRYIAEAEGNLVLQAFWRNLRRQDLEDAQRVKNRLAQEITPDER